ncbi:Efflux transporter, RND family, MFP subunit [Shewanella piezotolerans WP3]|uniref:Efflux transporter, RND family, MFP subunit n=2 Tax=Shewanella piezotolerans (strain WP3 / JCM 13877) TaxID=225849 RepID=B8CNT4_SHEPW|nr:efflux RND transporter periplasmic adaptor subunit [Shewanella piezotolerans]ACJ29053.1 Efflux transporter, RND family, MFP subunit [Shewanella piezotolerans WP3]
MKIKAWLFTGLALSTLVIILATVKYLEISAGMAYASAMPEYSETVETVKADSAEYTKTVEVIGNIVVPHHVVLRNESSGVVASVNFDSGDSVKQGDIIIQLDVDAELANIRSATARETLAQSIYNRSQKLRHSEAISQEQLDKAVAELAVIKAEIEVLKDKIRKKTIKAPFDGRLGIHTAKIGAFLDSNSKVVSVSGDTGFVWVDFYVPQPYSKLAVSSQVTISAMNSRGNDVMQAVILAANDAVNASVRSRLYRAKLPISSMVLDTNTAVTVSVPVNKVAEVFTVPNQAVLSDQNGQYVYLVVAEADGKGYRAKYQPIEVLASDAITTMVSQGLDSDDVIASAGAFKLFEGVLVNVQQAGKLISANKTSMGVH